MSNVLSEEKKQQVIALGGLGWPLRRIELATGVRRETAGDYLKAAGIAVRPPGAWGRRSPASHTRLCVCDDSHPGGENSMISLDQDYLGWASDGVLVRGLKVCGGLLCALNNYRLIGAHFTNNTTTAEIYTCVSTLCADQPSHTETPIW